MIDCHILVSKETPRNWVTQCLDSVFIARDHAGFPVTVHVIDGVPDHIGRARSQGYALGNEPYVAYVDDDDWVETDAFSCLHDAMISNATAIYTRETTWQHGKRGTFDGRQNLRVFRRDVLQGFNFDAWPIWVEIALSKHADKIGIGVDLPNRVYNYRIRQDGSRRLHAKHGDLRGMLNV